MDIIENGIGWVVITFSDGSVQCIHTSLNEKILQAHGAQLRKDYFFDLDRLCYIRFRLDADSVAVSVEKPTFSSEVLKFASRFI